MFEFFRSFFKKKEKENSVSQLIQELETGQYVELEYKHPNEVGVVGGQGLTCTRLNQDEINNRVIQGTILFSQRDDSIRKWLISIKVFKKHESGEIRERQFLFIEDEIKKLRLLT